jgi:hypothetical protein
MGDLFYAVQAQRNPPKIRCGHRATAHTSESISPELDGALASAPRIARPLSSQEANRKGSRCRRMDIHRATSKWNKIERRMFSHIAGNWQLAPKFPECGIVLYRKLPIGRN